jgi:Fe-S-cluster formation regulator IscX/YfhJ
MSKAKSDRPPKSSAKPKTVQRTYRFNTVLFEAFEDDCARYLSNPKRVIEALIRHWLDANNAQRSAIAERHRAWFGARDDDED